jgi:beta-N-acetylhexosaminidase
MHRAIGDDCLARLLPWYMFVLTIVSLALVASGCVFVSQPEHRSPQPKSIQAYIHEIVTAAQNGQTPNAPFTIGKTDIKDIQQKLGEPNQSNDTGVGLYAAYDKNKTTFGYYHHSPIFDARDYSEDLKRITLNDIEKAMGKPNKISSYDNHAVHQQILVYSLDNGIQLKWIIDKPTNENSNPAVDHISVYDPDIADHSLAAQLYNMSLDEKIGQMLMVGVNGTTPGNDAEEMIRNLHAGGFIFYGSNIKTANQTVDFINQLKAMNQSAKNPLPLFISVDEEGGMVDRMPSPILKMPSSFTIGKKDDIDFSTHVGEILGQAVRALGFNMDYAPVLDVVKNPATSAIADRSFGTDAHLVSRLGIATMRGIRSQQVIPVIKHFPGYGSVSVDAHQDLPTVEYGRSQLEKKDWLPYEEAIRNNADVIMVTHVLVTGLEMKNPASMSTTIMTSILRDHLGFKGVIMTDDMTMGAITKCYDIQSAVVKSVEAGSDVVMVSFHKDEQTNAFHALKQAVLNGALSEQRIDDSVYRIKELKQRYKLSDKPISYPNISSLNKEIEKILNQLR